MSTPLRYNWREAVSDAEITELFASGGTAADPGWWETVRPHSLGWVTARRDDGTLVGFVNVAWDGFRHAFCLDTQVRHSMRRRGVGTALVQAAADGARSAGCEWLHVDFEPHLARFYLDGCGFTATSGGLIHLAGDP